MAILIVGEKPSVSRAISSVVGANATKKSGMKHLRFHDLRHSCASLLLANDIPMKAIQEWLGHSNFAITANLYSHLEYNAKVNSAETIARVLGGNPAPKPEPEKTTEKKTAGKKLLQRQQANLPLKKQEVERRKAIIPMARENRKGQPYRI